MERGYKKVEGGKSIDYSFVADMGDGVPLKYCSKCNEDLPLYEFYANSYSLDGMQGHCIDCRKKYKQTPEYKVYNQKYQKEYRQSPESKAYQKAYHKTYDQTPKYKAYQKKYQKKYYLRKKLERLNEQNNPH